MIISAACRAVVNGEENIFPLDKIDLTQIK